MEAQAKTATVAVSYRLPMKLVCRLRDIANDKRRWPPAPSQTEIVARGIELVLRELEKRRK